MNELCFNTMNRSAYLIGDDDPDLPGQIDAAARAGFTLFGADRYSIERFVAEGGSTEALAKRIDHAGMRTFELPTFMVGTDATEIEAEVDALLPLARALRPDFVQVNILGEIDAEVLEATRRGADRFREVGARLAIEYLPWLPAIRNLASTRSFLDRAGIEDAGVLVDIWHFTLSDDTWEELEELPLEEIAYIQFDDHPALASDDLIAETVGRRVMPGEGRFELERFASLIVAKGYRGAVSCEILSDETRKMGLDEFARRVYDTSAGYWS